MSTFDELNSLDEEIDELYQYEQEQNEQKVIQFFMNLLYGDGSYSGFIDFADEPMSEETLTEFEGSPFSTYDAHRILSGKISREDFLIILPTATDEEIDSYFERLQ